MGTKEYEEQRIAYFNAIRQYNQEHPESTIGFDEDLPVAYSYNQVQQMRQVSNSIYGAYDRSMRAKYEWGAIGLTFATFSTWMNGTIANYFTKPGQYIGGPTVLTQDRDGSGNLLFFDKNGVECVEIIEDRIKNYYYTETGEKVEDLTGLAPINIEVPRVVQGIIYTLKDGFQALREGYLKGGIQGALAQWKKDISENPMQSENWRKLITDMLAILLFQALFKFAVDPAYKEFKKEDNTVVENALAEILYKSTSRSYDGFYGPLNVLQYLGENTNPPTWQVPIKVTTDLGKVVMGDKTFGEFMTGNVPLFRAIQGTYKEVLRTERQLEKESNNDVQ